MHGLKPKLIHRDLTSNNLFVTADFKIRIGDFGLCKAKSLSIEVAKEARSKGEKVAAGERFEDLFRSKFYFNFFFFFRQEQWV